MVGYDTNLAAEFWVLSALHRLGLNATLTLGNKKSVDIVIAHDAGKTLTIDVKGLAGTTCWYVGNVKDDKHHFVTFVTFLGKISDPSVAPEVYVVLSKEVKGNIYRNPKGTHQVIQVSTARKKRSQFKDNWSQLR